MGRVGLMDALCSGAWWITVCFFFMARWFEILDAVRLGAGFRAFICCFLLGYASSETRHDPLVLGSVAAVRLVKNILYQLNKEHN